MPRHRTHQPTEMCVCFNFDKFFSNVRKEIIKKFGKDISPERYVEEVQKNLNAFSLNGQQFAYTKKGGGWGSMRWYVLCPRCSKAKIKLFLPDKYDDREQRYLCSTCHLLKPLSLMNGRSPKYRTIIRPLKRMQTIKSILLSKSTLPPDVATKLLDEYETIERTLRNSPEYRIWRFNVEHGSLMEPGV